MKKIAFLVLTTLLVILAFGAVPPGGAVLSSNNVVVIPSYSNFHGGTLPTTDPAFSAFTFSTMPWASVSAASLAAYDTVVLAIYNTVSLSTAQKSDLIAWVSAGGKLIIYDSESVPGVDYSWLPYPFTTINPGAYGATAPIVFVENNTLGDTDPMSPYYIDISSAATGGWSDYVGDANIFNTFDPNWCGDIKVHNRLSLSDPTIPPSWTHAYAQYGDGIIIYNGFDVDPLRSYTTPSSTGTGNCAKIWLMELQQPWGTDWNLPCGYRVAGLTLEPQTATNLLGTSHTVIATLLDGWGNPVSNVAVTIQVISGPNTGLSGTSSTDSNGEVSLTYTGTTVGTDEIQANFTCTQCTPPRMIYSNTVEKTWESPGPGVPEFGLAMPLMVALLAAAYFLFSRRLKAGSIK